ncbi:MAG: MFS transporter [Endomicrobia bacterium]|nr:MFS transporter [Endomicrobiia bacterium]
MKNIILLGFTSLFTDISSEMVYPILGIYLASLNTPYSIIGLIEGVAESLSNLLRVFSGQISDKIDKRRPFVIFGYSLSALGKILLYVSGSWVFVLLARIVDRFGKGLRTAPRDALISESVVSEKKGKVFGLHRAMDTFGATLGVILVYFLFFTKNTSHFKKVFFYSIMPALVGVIILFFVKEVKKTKAINHTKKIILDIKSLKYIPAKAKKYVLVSAIFALGNSSNQFLLLKAKSNGVSYVNTILLYLFYNISYMLFSFPAGVVADKVGKKNILIIGYFIYSIVYFLFAISKTSYFLWILFVVYGLYIAAVEGQEKAFLSEATPYEQRATVLGLHYTVVGLLLFPASYLGGILWDKIGSYATFLFGSIMSFIAMLLMIIIL